MQLNDVNLDEVRRFISEEKRRHDDPSLAFLKRHDPDTYEQCFEDPDRGEA